MSKLWLFDFDGTLVDSEKAIKACYVKVGQELVPERLSFIETMVIGPTLEESARMILTKKKLDLLGEFKNRFQTLYDEKLVFETKPYPDVNKTLNKLHELGDSLCIVTNKRSIPTFKLINYYKWSHLFDWVACIDKYPLLKNKSELIRLKNINKKKYKKIYFVGDTITDGISAKENEINFILVAYGYGKNQSWEGIPIFKKINKFNEIVNL